MFPLLFRWVCFFVAACVYRATAYEPAYVQYERVRLTSVLGTPPSATVQHFPPQYDFHVAFGTDEEGQRRFDFKFGNVWHCALLVDQRNYVTGRVPMSGGVIINDTDYTLATPMCHATRVATTWSRNTQTGVAVVKIVGPQQYHMVSAHRVENPV